MSSRQKSCLQSYIGDEVPAIITEKYKSIWNAWKKIKWEAQKENPKGPTESWTQHYKPLLFQCPSSPDEIIL